MVERLMKIEFADGLDARPIAHLVQEASQYGSSIHIQVGSKNINAKSIMGMMSLRLAPGEEITVIAEGSDEAEAVNGIETFLHNL